MVGTNLLGRKTEERAQKDHEMIQAEFESLRELLQSERRVESAIRTEDLDLAKLESSLERLISHAKRRGH
jgi:signal transduction histidine kinase